MTPFHLQPFSPTLASDRLSLSGTCCRRSNGLFLRYELNGDLGAIALPQQIEHPQRRDNLWQTTCFEFFIGVEGDCGYWEFNLSPTGSWNCYRFADYRQGMMAEAALKDLVFSPGQKGDRYYLEVEFDLNYLGLATKLLEISITAVIEHQFEGISYWALIHTGKVADFHRRDSFRLRLN
jgi:hypothetical protein